MSHGKWRWWAHNIHTHIFTKWSIVICFCFALLHYARISSYLRAYLIFLQLLYCMRTKRNDMNERTNEQHTAKSFNLNMLKKKKYGPNKWCLLIRTVLGFGINRNHHKTKRRLRYQTCKIFHNFCVCFFSQFFSLFLPNLSLTLSLIPLKSNKNQILETKLMVCPFTLGKNETKEKKKLFIEKVICFEWLRSALFVVAFNFL